MSAKNELQELCQKRGFPLPCYYEPQRTGPSHSPSFSCEVTVEWHGNTLSERAEGKKKKEAQQKLASAMLERIRSLMEEDLYSESPASPSSQSKGMLQVYLQQRGYPLPLYEPQPTTGPSHKPLFTIRVRVRGGGGGVLWEGTGEGRTKKEAESTAARKCLEYFQLQEKEIPVFPRQHWSDPPPRQHRSDPPLGLVDASTDLDISSSILDYCPVYTTRPGADEGVWLCLGLTSNQTPPVASHGKGTSEEEAQRDAALNLNQNIHKTFINRIN